MQPSNATLALIGMAFLFVVIISVLVYVWLGTRIAANGGKVRVEKFGLTDLFVGGLLIACFVSLSFNGFNAPPVVVHDSGLVSSALVYYVILTLICAFLHFRGIDVPDQFGLRVVKFAKVAGIALLLLLAALPMIYCVNAIMQQALKGDAKPQELVKYFVDALQHRNYRSVFLTLFTGAVVAPVAEEFIFRGYIYGILKRYLGIVPGIVLNAALFAAVHLNTASLPGLFLLAVCFTLAYEFTGSILVNMCMHSLFNLSTFAILLCLPPTFPQ